MIASPAFLAPLVLLLVAGFLWLILRTFESETARRARLLAGIAAAIGAVEVGGVLLLGYSDRLAFHYLKLWSVPFSLLFQLWPAAVIVLLWKILQAIRAKR